MKTVYPLQTKFAGGIIIYFFCKCGNILLQVTLRILETCKQVANNEDPDEMQHNAAFHLGLHCLLRLKQTSGILGSDRLSQC